MKIPYNILIQIKMSVRPYFKGFTLIFFFYNCRKQDYISYWVKRISILHTNCNKVIRFVPAGGSSTVKNT